MLKPDGWNLAPSQSPTRQQTSVARDHIKIGVDEDRDVEPEGLDAVSDLTNLFRAMLARVLRSGFSRSGGTWSIDSFVLPHRAPEFLQFSAMRCSSTFAARGRSARIGRYVEPHRLEPRSVEVRNCREK